MKISIMRKERLFLLCTKALYGQALALGSKAHIGASSLEENKPG